jgi:hypothetical protein
VLAFAHRRAVPLESIINAMLQMDTNANELADSVSSSSDLVIDL